MGINKVTLGKTDVNFRALTMALGLAKAAKVGYPIETTGGDIHEEAQVPLATLAAWNELGTENTPPRPFMRQGAEILVARRGLVVPHLRRMLQGKTHGDAFIGAVGLLLKSSIISAVKRQSFTPLAPATVKAKGSSEILIDSGEMIDGLDVHLDRL